MRGQKKLQNGITMVALIITIIVLLILAGVSLSFVVGDNGILRQASNSVVKNRTATAEEEVALAWSTVDSEYWADWANNASLEKSTYFTVEKLNAALGTKGQILTTGFQFKEDDTSTLTYKRADNSQYTMTIDVNGVVEIQ